MNEKFLNPLSQQAKGHFYHYKISGNYKLKKNRCSQDYTKVVMNQIFLRNISNVASPEYDTIVTKTPAIMTPRIDAFMKSL